MLSTAVRPARDEAAEYYFKYIDVVPDGDICAILYAQCAETLAFLRSIPAQRSDIVMRRTNGVSARWWHT